MCGHATIASVCDLYEAGYIGIGKIKIQTSEDIFRLHIQERRKILSLALHPALWLHIITNIYGIIAEVDYF